MIDFFFFNFNIHSSHITSHSIQNVCYSSSFKRKTKQRVTLITHPSVFYVVIESLRSPCFFLFTTARSKQCTDWLWCRKYIKGHRELVAVLNELHINLAPGELPFGISFLLWIYMVWSLLIYNHIIAFNSVIYIIEVNFLLTYLVWHINHTGCVRQYSFKMFLRYVLI